MPSEETSKYMGIIYLCTIGLASLFKWWYTDSVNHIRNQKNGYENRAR